jgi:hypothetical protein
MSKIINIGNNDTDIFNDFSIFTQYNTIIGQYAAKGIKGSNNVILGRDAGSIAFDINNSVLIGTDAGKSMFLGAKNYIIGNDNSTALFTNKLFNIGYNHIYKDNSITIGNNISNLYQDFIIGGNNKNVSINSSNIQINNYSFGNIINLGSYNKQDFININIGNYNSNYNINTDLYNPNIINIGSHNKSIINYDNSKYILTIGNHINNYKFSLNIDNIICAYDPSTPDSRIIYLGIGFYENIPIIIGSRNTDLFNQNINSNNLFINGALSTNSIKFTNDNHAYINLINFNSPLNITYHLPPYPTSNIDNTFLSTDINGNLEWIEVKDAPILTIITDGNTICNDLISCNISGNGRFLRNINFDGRTTNDLNNGIINHYLTTSIIHNYFLFLTSNFITTDDIIPSNSNIFFSSQLYSSNFSNNLRLITLDDIKQGSNKFYSSNDFYRTPRILFTSQYNTDQIIQGSSNLLFNDTNFSNNSSNVFNIVREGRSNLFYTNSRFLNSFHNYLYRSNTDIIREGSNQLFYKSTTATNAINNYLANTATTDFIREGKSNLYVTDSRLVNFFNSKIITTNDIKVSNNLNYFNSNSIIPINNDFIKEGSNQYFTNSRALNIINGAVNTDILKSGTSNIYGTESRIVGDFNKLIPSNINTNLLNESPNSSNKFIKNNFYNNNLNINGFIKGSNINNLDFDILKSRVQEISIGEKTEVITNYNVSSMNINTPLSNIEISYSYDGVDTSSNVPFIIINNKVGILNPAPRYQLDINGNLNCSNIFLNESNIFTTSRNSNLIFHSNTFIGLGTTNPVERLHVIGNIVATGNIVSAFSDIRLKTIIEPLHNPLDVISKLNGFKYKYNSNINDLHMNMNMDNEKIMIGLNAQEVQKVIPEIVSIAPIDMNENGQSLSGHKYLTIQYERIIPYLIESIKELKKENDELKLISSNLIKKINDFIS